MWNWVPAYFAIGAIPQLVFLCLFAFTARVTNGPRTQHLTLDPDYVPPEISLSEPRVFERMDEARQKAMRWEDAVMSPFGYRLWQPDLVGDRARAAAVALTAFAACGLAVAAFLGRFAPLGEYGLLHRVALTLLLTQALVTTAAALAAVYFFEILWWGSTLWVWPSAIALWLASIGLLALGWSTARESQRIETDELAERRVDGVYLSRQEAAALLEPTEAALRAAGKAWRFAGCVVTESYHVATGLGSRTVRGERHEGPLLELPGSLLPLLSQDEWLAWVPAALETPQVAEEFEARWQQELSAHRGVWHLLSREAAASGLGRVALLPFRPAFNARAEIGAHRLARPTPLEQLGFDPPLPAVQAILKAALLPQCPFAGGVAEWPRRWQAWLANQPAVPMPPWGRTLAG
jgi:hypothetical protein